MARHLRIPVAGTILDANDTEGDGFPLLLLSGQFATQRSWKKLLQLLGDRYRVVTYDTRARGRSGTSDDYSFGSNVDDISAVLQATGIRQPVLVGWSYGAALAVRHAALHPDAVSGMVSIDGAYPMVLEGPSRAGEDPKDVAMDGAADEGRGRVRPFGADVGRAGRGVKYRADRRSLQDCCRL